MFEMDHVHKRLGAAEVLRGIGLTVARGETLILIGPSGCGKSTILRLLLGLLAPDAGTIRFDGEPLRPGVLQSVRRRCGYLIQDGGLFPHLTARENILLMARECRWPQSRVRARLDELLSLTRFPPEALSRYPVELSGGQRQRVALMRALMLDPDALLLDEPLAALDPMVRFELQEDLRSVFIALRKTCVLVTHDLAEAAFFGERIVLLRDGRIVQIGSISEMARSPAEAFVTEFLRAQRAAPALPHGNSPVSTRGPSSSDSSTSEPAISGSDISEEAIHGSGISEGAISGSDISEPAIGGADISGSVTVEPSAGRQTIGRSATGRPASL